MDLNRLDDLGFVLKHDPRGMYRLTVEFPQQCLKALDVAEAAQLPHFRPNSVVLTGLGGSAAGGDFVKALFDVYGHVPFSVNRDYQVPNHVGRESLVFVCSYSGNTEETLSAYEDARRRGATIIAVTSGGSLADRAVADGCSIVRVPGGQPPRTALGYMMIPVVVACGRMGLLPPQDIRSIARLLDDCLGYWDVSSPAGENPAKQVAEALHGKVGVFYGLGAWQSVVASRWKSQMNENAKSMAFWNAFPELNHNEILGWVHTENQGNAQWLAVILEDGFESKKMQMRARVTGELIGGFAPIIKMRASGATMLEKMLSLALLGDLVSIYLAALNEVDPENIDWLNILKSELAKVP